MNFHDRDLAIKAIREWSLAKPYDVAKGRALTVDELVRLARNKLLDIGAHTQTHPVLTALPLEEQRDEICMSRKQLEEILDGDVLGFSYPNGILTSETREIVRESGFRFACSSQMNLVRPDHDIYELPRFWPKDMDGDDFLKSLRRWISWS
jgi:peptidoglycan/xylan/chitin deacetylase (PgdA/CDA1 family)